MNSFNFAAKGIENEVARQIKIYESGGTVEQETLHFDPDNEDAPPLRSQGGGAGLPLLPGARPRAGAAAGRARRASCGGRSASFPSDRIRRIAETLSFYDADVLVTGGLDRLWSAVVDAGADPKETANVLANAFVATGVDPERVNAAELAKLVSARAEIPRDAFDEALAHSGDDGFSAEPYLAQKAVSDVAELDPVIDAGHRREPGAGRAVPRRQGGPARLLRRPGDEGDRRQGRPARRQRRGSREKLTAR